MHSLDAVCAFWLALCTSAMAMPSVPPCDDSTLGPLLKLHGLQVSGTPVYDTTGIRGFFTSASQFSCADPTHVLVNPANVDGSSLTCFSVQGWSLLFADPKPYCESPTDPTPVCGGAKLPVFMANALFRPELADQVECDATDGTATASCGFSVPVGFMAAGSRFSFECVRSMIGERWVPDCNFQNMGRPLSLRRPCNMCGKTSVEEVLSDLLTDEGLDIIDLRHESKRQSSRYSFVLADDTDGSYVDYDQTRYFLDCDDRRGKVDVDCRLNEMIDDTNPCDRSCGGKSLEDFLVDAYGDEVDSDTCYTEFAGKNTLCEREPSCPKATVLVTKKTFDLPTVSLQCKGKGKRQSWKVSGTKLSTCEPISTFRCRGVSLTDYAVVSLLPVGRCYLVGDDIIDCERVLQPPPDLEVDVFDMPTFNVYPSPLPRGQVRYACTANGWQASFL